MGIVNGLHFQNIRGDIYGGVTAAIVALPLALAFGVASGAGPIAGLYGAIFIGFFAALFGGTPSQISGPTGPMTVVMAAIIADYVARDPVQGPALAFTTVMLGGIFQILFGVFKFGRYISLVPFPVISGFMSGIGFIIILLQIGPLLGHASPPGGPLASLLAIPEFLANITADALILGLITLSIVYFLPARINRLIPAQLLALIVGTLALLFAFPGASTLGNIPTGFPVPQVPTFQIGMITDMVKSGLALAILGAIDSLLTSLVADNITRTHHESDRELIGQGIGNLVAGVFGGLPGAGATMRTVVNVRAGGQTPIAGVLHAMILLAIVLGAGELAKYIPHAVLAGILIKVGIDIVDWDFFKRLHHASRPAIGLMFSVLFITIFVDLITAVAFGMVGASILLVYRMANLQLENMRIFTSLTEDIDMPQAERALLDKAGGRILFCHLTGPLSFGASKGMMRRFSAYQNYDILLLDFTDVSMIDFTSSKAIEDIVLNALRAKRQVHLVARREHVLSPLKRLNILDLPETSLFSTRLEALHSAISKFETPPPPHNLRHSA